MSHVDGRSGLQPAFTLKFLRSAQKKRGTRKSLGVDMARTHLSSLVCGIFGLPLALVAATLLLCRLFAFGGCALWHLVGGDHGEREIPDCLASFENVKRRRNITSTGQPIG